MVYDVIVIGAGVAGLAAARVCAEAGLQVIVLESSERVGGRIRTQRVGEVVVELGAEFVHGQAPELIALIEEAGLTTYERTGDFLLRTEDGFALREDHEDAVLESLKEYAGEDCSFVEYVDALGLRPEERAAEIGYVEGFNAADAREASVIALGRQQVAEDAIEGGRNWRVLEGYDRVPTYVAHRVTGAGGEIVFGARVEAVDWGEETVRVETDDTCYRARRVVVAVPLGVLHGAVIQFKPSGLAWEKARLSMGDVCRVTMIFEQRLWPAGMSFLLTPALLPGVWWTAHPAQSASLTGWVGGPRALTLLSLQQEELETACVDAVAAALGRSSGEIREGLVALLTVDWRGEDGARGAYSWVRVGGAEDSAAMAAPVANRLYFAGEHTDVTGHWGTVHGALRSGLRAGGQVVAGFRGD